MKRKRGKPARGVMLDRPEIRIGPSGEAMLVTHVDEAGRPTRQYRFAAEVRTAAKAMGWREPLPSDAPSYD